MKRGQHKGEEGQILVLAAIVLAFLFVPLAVYVIDSGLIEASYLQLGETLQTAAEDGASSLDTIAYRQSGGQIVRLDSVQAQQVASHSLQVSNLSGLENKSVQVQGNTVTVQAHLRVQLLVIGTVTLSQQRSANFAYGR
jgi:hypothetical protein